MKILINDDSILDRKSLRKIIERISTEYEIVETSNLDDFYHELYQVSPCQLLFQDISLKGDKKSPDSEGLNVLYDITNDFPDLPVVIVTGHYYEKVREFHDVSLCRTLQFIDYLDKGTYGENEILSVFNKAEHFHQEFKKNCSTKRATEELLHEIAQHEENSIRRKVNKQAQNVVGDLENELLYRNAFSGDNWKERVKAEFRVTGNTCNSNAADLCIRIETGVLNAFHGKKEDCSHFKAKTGWLRDNHKISTKECGIIDKAWSLRNQILHGKKQANLEDALLLANTYEILQRI
jgi:FixJ family two-component response regulator